MSGTWQNYYLVHLCETEERYVANQTSPPYPKDTGRNVHMDPILVRLCCNSSSSSLCLLTCLPAWLASLCTVSLSSLKHTPPGRMYIPLLHLLIRLSRSHITLTIIAGPPHRLTFMLYLSIPGLITSVIPLVLVVVVLLLMLMLVLLLRIFLISSITTTAPSITTPTATPRKSIPSVSVAVTSSASSVEAVVIVIVYLLRWSRLCGS